MHHMQRILLILPLLAACAGASDRPLHHFPSQQELLRIQQGPPPAKVLRAALGSSAGWSAVTPAAEEIARSGYDDPTPLGQALSQVAKARGLELSGALRCVAEEVGRFTLSRRAPPSQSLLRFLAARCGAVATGLRTTSMGGESKAGAPTEAELARWRDGAGEWLRQSLSASQGQVGLWSGVEGGRVVAQLVLGEPRVTLEPQRLIPDELGRVMLRGALRGDAEHVAALVNWGSHGALPCARDLRLALPRFAFTCPISEKDGRAWIQVMAKPAGKVLSNSVLELLVHRSAADVASYALVNADEAAPATDAATFTAALLPVLNQARAAGGMQPLVLAEQQSQTATALAPHFFAAYAGEGDPQIQERIALGLMAGWEVGGEIRGGDLVVALHGPGHDVREWLANALELPIGRRVLLGRAARRIALGPLVSAEPAALAAVVTTYSFFESADHQAEATQVIEELAELRRQHEVPGPVVLVRDLSERMAAQAQRLQKGQSPTEALQAMLEQISSLQQTAARGFVFQSSDLSALRLPPELWRGRGRLPVAVTVTHYKPKGAAWAHLVVFLVALAPSPEA